jgi:hypothetical protein
MNQPHRRRRGPDRWHPRYESRHEPPAPVYHDGAYVISRAGEAITWGICENGRWGIVYQCSGVEVLAAWVEVRSLPLHVLAQALEGPTQ